MDDIEYLKTEERVIEVCKDLLMMDLVGMLERLDEEFLK